MINKNAKKEIIEAFEKYLIQEEKSKATIEKYIRDVNKFYDFIGDRFINKEEAISYKNYLTENYAPSSVNSMLVSLNCYLSFSGYTSSCVKLLKIQRQIFSCEEKELTKEEYKKLIKASENTRLCFVMQTICSTGIRVSELKYITVEAVKKGKAVINCKNKTRIIFIPVFLQNLLAKYIKKTGIKTGTIFVTKSGKPLNRSNIWRDMKMLCKKAGISSDKVFPHNLRHLFARTFYTIEKDIVRLADILGHSSIDTTRIYTKETGFENIVRLEQVQIKLTT